MNNSNDNTINALLCIYKKVESQRKVMWDEASRLLNLLNSAHTLLSVQHYYNLIHDMVFVYGRQSDYYYNLVDALIEGARKLGSAEILAKAYNGLLQGIVTKLKFVIINKDTNINLVTRGIIELLSLGANEASGELCLSLCSNTYLKLHDRVFFCEMALRFLDADSEKHAIAESLKKNIEGECDYKSCFFKC